MILQAGIVDIRGEAVSQVRQPCGPMLRKRLVTGVFAGRLHSGQRLVVQQLAKAYEVSPTPVREALVEMASLGLVERACTDCRVVRQSPIGGQDQPLS